RCARAASTSAGFSDVSRKCANRSNGAPAVTEQARWSRTPVVENTVVENPAEENSVEQARLAVDVEQFVHRPAAPSVDRGGANHPEPGRHRPVEVDLDLVEQVRHDRALDGASGVPLEVEDPPAGAHAVQPAGNGLVADVLPRLTQAVAQHARLLGRHAARDLVTR